MGWTLPTSWTAGHVVTGTELNTHLRDDMRYLKGLDGTVSFSDAIQIGTCSETIGIDGVVNKGMMENHSHTGTGECGTVHHGALIGLADDDHPQYFLRSIGTATGDIAYYGTAGWVRLAKGSDGQYLYLSAGTPAWVNSPEGAKAIKAGDTTRNSNDTERTTNATAYAKVKEIKLNGNLAGCRVYFEVKSDGLGAVAAKTYLNGTAVGVEKSTAVAIYTSQTDDLSILVVDDLVQIYAYANDPATAYVQNMRLKYDRHVVSFGTDTLTTSLLTTSDPTISVTVQDP